MLICLFSSINHEENLDAERTPWLYADIKKREDERSLFSVDDEKIKRLRLKNVCINNSLTTNSHLRSLRVLIIAFGDNYEVVPYLCV